MPTPKREHLLATTAVVTDQVKFRRAQLIFRNLPISDREATDMVQDVFRDLDGEGVELWKPKEFVPYPLIDDSWGGDDRYLRKFLKLDRCVFPERDKFLFLLLERKYPHLYRHLAR